MKFPVDKCFDCGLDLTTAEPAEVRNFDNRMAIGTCPKCGKEYFMSEVTPPSPEPETKPKSTRRKASKPEAEAGPESPLGEAPAEEAGPEE